MANNSVERLPLEIVLATRNGKKIKEIRRVVPTEAVSFLTLDDFPGCPPVEEDGATFQENAEKKAREVARFTGRHALADDSGLVVDALDGAPGVHSARYAGPQADDGANLSHLLASMTRVADPQRTARFECVLSLAAPDGRTENFFGTVAGRIDRQPRGENGFGYDPVFIPEGNDRTFAEMAAADKDAISHRGRALTAFAEAVRNRH